MIKPIKLVYIFACLATCGCQSHMIFVEEEQAGLKVAYAPNNPSPAQVTLALRRGLVAVVPQQSLSEIKTTNAVNVTTQKINGTNYVTVIEDPNELMSLYTRFQANLGLAGAIRFNHFLATGNAAIELLANAESLRQITTNFDANAKP